MAAAVRADTQREALWRLVARINAASERRDRAARGSGEFHRAGEALRHYRRVLLDDELFGRYIDGDPRLDVDGVRRSDGVLEADMVPARDPRRSPSGKLDRRTETSRRGAHSRRSHRWDQA